MTRSKTNLLVLAGTVVGIILGVLLGRMLPDPMLSLSLIGRLYLNALLFIAALMLLAGTVAGAAEAWNYRQGFFSGPRFYVLSSTVAATAGLGILIMLLGEYVRWNPLNNYPSQFLLSRPVDFGDFLVGLVPRGLMEGVFSLHFIGLFVLALLFGAVLHNMTSRGRTVASFFSEVCGGLRRVNNLFFYAAPAGVLLLTAGCVALGPITLGGLFYPALLVVGLVLYSSIALPWIVQSWSRRRLEELSDRNRTGSETESSGYRQRHGRYEGGSYGFRDRSESRGGDRGRYNRPQSSRGPRPDRPPQRDSSSPFAVKASSDSPFDQPTPKAEPAHEESSAKSHDESAPQQRDYSSPRRDYDRRGGERGGERSGERGGDRGGERGGRDRDRDRDRDRRPSGRRDDRGRPDRRPGGRRPYSGGGSYTPSPSTEEAPPTPILTPTPTPTPMPMPTPAPVSEISTPVEPGSFEDRVFGGAESAAEPNARDHSESGRRNHDDEPRTDSGHPEEEKTSDSAESNEVRYGRSRYHRPPQITPESGEKAEESVATPAAAEEPASNEPVEFGRFRRKRFGQK